jgi:hypothetical protein
MFNWPYAVDNECYTLGDDFDEDRWWRAVERIADAHGPDSCLFVVSPDMVADAAATLERATNWLPKIREIGLPAALAAQDGLEQLDIPWDAFDALFVGGSTKWKLGIECARLMAEARRRDKWLHVGRVNSLHRASRLLVQPDSVDGTAWARHPAKYANLWENWRSVGFARQLPLWEFTSLP